MMVRMARKQLSVVQALGQDRADRRLAILREIGVQGSISQAARVVSVSYKAAWQALDTLTNLAGVALVERVVGGAGGGGARLTQAAHELLAAADTLARERSNAAQGSGAHQAAAQLSVRTSMRSQWPCVVTALRRQGSIVDVVLAARGDEALLALSRITRESAQLLGLAPGLPVQCCARPRRCGCGRARRPMRTSPITGAGGCCGFHAIRRAMKSWCSSVAACSSSALRLPVRGCGHAAPSWPVPIRARWPSW